MPNLTALRDEAALPSGVRGPVECCALATAAVSWAGVAMSESFPKKIAARKYPEPRFSGGGERLPYERDGITRDWRSMGAPIVSSCTQGEYKSQSPELGVRSLSDRRVSVAGCIVKTTMRFRFLGMVFGVLAAAASGEVRFNRDIRPIMAETCFRCHGPDKNSRMAGMRLDIRGEGLKPTARGVTPIVPGDPDKSAIVQRVFATGARIMPPAFAHKELTQAQKETIRQWVAEGAKYEGHWAYQPVKRAETAGNGNPIDYFIGERLKREGLAPSPEADRRTLIRRVTLDLTGLPPTAAEIGGFEKEGDYEIGRAN